MVGIPHGTARVVSSVPTSSLSSINATASRSPLASPGSFSNLNSAVALPVESVAYDSSPTLKYPPDLLTAMRTSTPGTGTHDPFSFFTNLATSDLPLSDATVSSSSLAMATLMDFSEMSKPLDESQIGRAHV